MVGSIYATIKYVVGKTHDVLVAKKAAPIQTVEIRPTIDGMTITGELEPLIAQLRRVAGKGTSIKSDYIHGSSVEWLREAIDDKIEKDNA